MGKRFCRDCGGSFFKVCGQCGKRAFRLSRHPIIVSLLVLVPVTLIIIVLLIDSRRTTTTDCMNLLISQSVGSKEKTFLSQRLNSDASINLYKFAIDHELDTVMKGGHSPLLQEKLSVAPIIISSAQLATDYVNSEVAADARYRNQDLLVSGTVQDVELDDLDTPYLSLKGSHVLQEVQLTFAPQREVINYISAIHLNSFHRFFCKGDGIEMMSVGLRDCTPAAVVYRRIAEDFKRTCILKITYGQVYNRLDKQANPVLRSQALALLLKSEYAVFHFNECRQERSEQCLAKLNEVQEPQVYHWLTERFRDNGITLSVDTTL